MLFSIVHVNSSTEMKLSWESILQTTTTKEKSEQRLLLVKEDNKNKKINMKKDICQRHPVHTDAKNPKMGPLKNILLVTNLNFTQISFPPLHSFH